MIVGPINSGAAAGGAGVATANANSSIRVCGYVMAVHVKYNDSPPAGTTDVTIKTAGTAIPSLTFLTLTNGATDGWRFPQLLLDDSAGADLTGVYGPPYIDDYVNVAIAQANDADNVDVILLIDPGY